MAEPNSPANADAVSRAVALFLTSMMTDPLLSWAFDGIDQARLQRHAFSFVVAALGGPDLYLGRGMREVHAPFALRDEHFDAAVVHLLSALREVGISEGVTSGLAVSLEPLRGQIVSAN